MSKQTLRKGHLKALGFDKDKATEKRHVSSTLENYYQKHEELRGIPGHVIRKAWFTMAHMILAPGAKVADMGCLPPMTYAMAVLNPHIKFVGVNHDRKYIKEAQKAFQRDNLEFLHDDIRAPQSIEQGSLDAVVNSFILHQIFSAQKYSDRPVVQALETHFDLLKQEGLMLVRDFATLMNEEYVVLEMPDKDSKSEALEDLSEADLLVWYAQNARPRGSRSCEGFFLEELPPRFPQTRLFRLPSKWAYEFIMRKDDRETLRTTLSREYTFFTERDYRKSLRGLGARVLYSSPHWDDTLIRERFDGHFRLYTDEGKPMGPPPTSFTAVAQKLGEKKSLRLHERRPSPDTDSKIRITAMRNEANGKIFDIISRDTDVTEILPYRVTETGQLNIFVHDGLPRGITNAVPRTGKSIDGKRWSGHMTEAITLPTDLVHDAENGEPKALVLFARDYLGLKPAMGSTLERGQSFYPAPDLIDEQIKTRYLRVTEHTGTIEPRHITQDLEGFTTRGRIREVSAQSLLDAISVGFLPNARLEIQILSLCEKLGIEAETWQECPLALDDGEPEQMFDGKKFASTVAGEDRRYKNIKGATGQIRPVKSIFVDEGWVDGGIEGLAARDIEFVVADDQTVNKAVILPLTKQAGNGEAMIGLVSEYLPVPQRHKGNGMTLRAPSVTLPKEITSIDQAKRYIAEKFEVPPEKVARLGESYFCHLGVTPVRLFPFAVATTGESRNPFGGPVQFAPMDYFNKMFEFVDDYIVDLCVVYWLKKAGMLLGQTSEVTMDWERSKGCTKNEIWRQDAPAILNSSNADGMTSSAPAAESAANANTTKSAENSTTGRQPENSDILITQSPSDFSSAAFISSPDFLDIQSGSDQGGSAYTARHNQEPAQDKRKKKQYKTK